MFSQPGVTMRLTFVWTLLLIGSHVAISEQSDASSYNQAPSRSQENKDPLLELTTKTIKQRYCAGDDEGGTLQLSLHLRYTNLGNKTILLYKGSDIVSQIMVSRNGDEAIAKRFEFTMSISTYTQGSNKAIRGESPNSSFAVLKPGQFFQTETMVPIPFRRVGGTDPLIGGASPGDHVLQIMIPTWPESKHLAEILSTRWRSKGMLWYDTVTSLPMPIKIEEPRVFDDYE